MCIRDRSREGVSKSVAVSRSISRIRAAEITGCIFWMIPDGGKTGAGLVQEAGRRRQEQEQEQEQEAGAGARSRRQEPEPGAGGRRQEQEAGRRKQDAGAGGRRQE